MSAWSEQQYIKYIADSSTKLSANDEKPFEGSALVGACKRKDESVPGIGIRFRVYAVRPADWDGWDFKGIQDMLVKSKIIPDDKWNVIECIGISSFKVQKIQEEKTVIELVWFK